MIWTLKTLVLAKSQHRPDRRWFVTGEPSKGMRVLKVWVSLKISLWFVRIEGSEFWESAEMASLFYQGQDGHWWFEAQTLGSFSKSSSHSSVTATETSSM
jgi:hypothetical protein